MVKAPLLSHDMNMQGYQLQEILAGNIRRIRKNLKLTQAELAEKAEISTGYMCDIERSRRWPSAENITRLAQILHVDPFQLLLPTEDSPYFDRHRTLAAFSRELQDAFEKSSAEIFERLVQPFGSEQPPAETNQE